MEKRQITVSITAEYLKDLLGDILRVSRQADLIEVRLDYLKDRNVEVNGEEILRTTFAVTDKPLIYTFRSGKKEITPNQSIQEINSLINSRSAELAKDYFDFELSSDNTVVMQLYNIYKRVFNSSPKIILSYHNFESCQLENLLNIYSCMTKQQADVIKIAAQASQVTDQLAIFSLLKKAKEDNQPLIALAMGEAGRISRVLAPSKGSFTTFTALKKGSESAPGQFTLSEMSSLYRPKSINEETKIYALLGCPVSHSVSPHIHNMALNTLGQMAVYLPINVPTNELDLFMEKFICLNSKEMNWQFMGASVTVPHKINIQKFLDEIDPIAKEIGAVNTIVVKEGRLIGYNTDVIGAIAPLLKIMNLNKAKVAVLGTGGAARAVVAGLKHQGAEIIVYGRNQEVLKHFASVFDIEIKPFSESDKVSCDLLINTTPIGMFDWPSDINMPIMEEALKNCARVYDLVYNPIATPLLDTAHKLGIPIISGLEMLIAQAAEQLKLWTQLEPPVDLMRSAAYKALSQKQNN